MNGKRWIYLQFIIIAFLIAFCALMMLANSRLEGRIHGVEMAYAQLIEDHRLLRVFVDHLRSKMDSRGIDVLPMPDSVITKEVEVKKDGSGNPEDDS